MRSEGKIYYDDWMNNGLPDKSVQLIIADPPYYKVKGDFDFVWKTFDDYLKDVEKWAVECKRVLADNGTLYWYGDAKNIAYAQIIFDKHFNLLNSLVWENTNDHKQQIRFNPDLRTFAPLTERILMYENNSEPIEVFKPIREYLWNEYKKTGLSYEKINELIGTTSKGGGGMAYNTLSITRTNWDMPKEYIYKKLQETGYFKKEYEELRKEYEELRRPFNNERFYGDVIRLPNYETGNHEHDTPKPEKLTRELILISSRKNDLVLVPFAGSGTECAMAAKEGRRFIGFDTELKHVEYANKRCETILSQPQLF